MSVLYLQILTGIDELYSGAKLHVPVYFESHFNEAMTRGRTIVEHHKIILASHKDTFRQIRESEICLSCMLRPAANNLLTCGHALCNVCVVIHGSRCLVGSSPYTVKLCPLCLEPNSRSLKLMPINCSWRVLVIDGGSPVHYAVLQEIEESLGPCGRIVEYFDYINMSGNG